MQLYRTVYEIVFLNLDLAGGALTWAVAHAAMYPSCQQRLVDELHQCPVLPKDHESVHDATYRVVQSEMQYLDWFVQESARVEPALAVLLPPETMLANTVIDGYRVPAGVRWTCGVAAVVVAVVVVVVSCGVAAVVVVVFCDGDDGDDGGDGGDVNGDDGGGVCSMRVCGTLCVRWRVLREGCGDGDIRVTTCALPVHRPRSRSTRTL